MVTKRKSAAFAAFLMAGLMVLGTACGGSSSKSSDSSGGASGESSATTSKSSGGGGGNSSSCAELFNKTQELSEKMDAIDTGADGTSTAGLNDMVKALESFSSSVPSEIRDDWKTIVAGIKEYVNAMKGIDFNNLTDPATMEKLTKATAAFEDSKYQKASDNLDAWTQKNCPGFDF